jgi:NAD(P)-dependent dehydrogenase (short-subunit alcohol dehydrogenase family)
MTVNFTAPVFLAQAFAAALGDREGDIVNMIDQRAWRTAPTYFTYQMSKSALWAATRVMAQALAPRIRVNAIAPGPVLPSERQDAGDFDARPASTACSTPPTTCSMSARRRTSKSGCRPTRGPTRRCRHASCG